MKAYFTLVDSDMVDLSFEDLGLTRAQTIKLFGVIALERLLRIKVTAFSKERNGFVSMQTRCSTL